MKTTIRLDAEWRTGGQGEHIATWQFPFVTRVHGFELQEPIRGELLSIIIAGQEQLALVGGVTIVYAAQHYGARTIPDSPSRGWKLGPILLQIMQIGVTLAVTTRNFAGQMRPFGAQIRGHL